MLTELNLREMISQINAISNDLNKLDNYNKKDRRYKELYSWFLGRYTRVFRRFAAEIKAKAVTRSRKLTLKPVYLKLTNLRKKIQLKYPNFPMSDFTTDSRRYTQSNSRQKNDKIKNNIFMNRHEFSIYYVNDLPKDAMTLNNIKSGNRAIKVNKSIYSLRSFRILTRSSIHDVLGRHGNSILFVDPLTRQTIRRSQITPIKIRRGPSASEIYGKNV